MSRTGIRPLGDTIGAEVVGVDGPRLASDVHLAMELLPALERHGVLVFRDVGLTPEQQVAFCRHLGAVDCTTGNSEIEGVYRISLDPATNGRSAAYLRATFAWHVDGCTSDVAHPQMATLLSAVALAARGGHTEFASAYAAYDTLPEDEQRYVATLRVVHSLEASQRLATPDPTPEQLAAWRSRPVHEHPLVWTHRSGRRSLLLGASTDHVVGLPIEQGRELLADLLARATTPERIYRHEWSVGDTVIWDNRGVLHRATPYDETSGREMLRTTILGDEPIR